MSGSPIFDRLLRPHLRTVTPYATAAAAGARTGILLDANENSLGTLVPEAGDTLHRYPDPVNRPLRSGLARHLGVPSERIWVGNGSDEALDILFRACVGPGEAVVIPEPTYGMYVNRARAYAAEVRSPRLDDRFDLDLAETLRMAAGAKLVLLCSPNNPTGNHLDVDRILALVQGCRAVVAVDEAYVEFSNRPSLAARAGELERLVVIRTFSKAWGLAGARVGYLVGDSTLVRHLELVGLPYPLSSLAAGAALSALSRQSEMEDRRTRLVAERERVKVALERLGARVLPSEANFLLFFVDDPARVRAALASGHGIHVRDRSDLPGLRGALRVTIGSPAENEAFIGALGAVAGRGKEVEGGAS